jgi:ribosomal subunit interface protein
MIKQIKITGISYEVDVKTRKYIADKIGHLDRYLPRHAVKSASAEVKLWEVNHDHGDKFEVEIIVDVPGKIATAKVSNNDVLVAFNMVEAKIQSQLRDYKQISIAHIGKRGIMSRFKRSFKREL